MYAPFEASKPDPRSLKDWKKNLVGMKINGTTFSGHPTRTTLGNTLRSLCYVNFMAQRFGFENLSLAAGDDVIMWVHKRDAHKVFHAVSYISRDDPNDPVPHGLGQCIKEVKMSMWWDIDFCSRSSVLIGNHWYILRDPSKIVKNKQLYFG